MPAGGQSQHSRLYDQVVCFRPADDLVGVRRELTPASYAAWCLSLNPESCSSGVATGPVRMKRKLAPRKTIQSGRALHADGLGLPRFVEGADKPALVIQHEYNSCPDTRHMRLRLRQGS